MKRRNRRKVNAHPIGFATLDMWRNSAEDRTWTATEPRFRKLLSVLINERAKALDHAPIPIGCVMTENARYGVAMGYEAALQVLEKMGAEPEPIQEPSLEQEYPNPENDLHETAITD